MPAAGPAAHRRACRVVLTACLAVALLGPAPRAVRPSALRLAGPEAVADGVALYRSTDSSTLDPATAGPVSIVLARLDPRKVTLGTALANDCAPARETVEAIAAREHAVVAVNAGFFSMRGAGAPAGLLKHRGRWISGSSRARGAVAFLSHGPTDPAALAFDRVTVSAAVTVSRRRRPTRLPLDHLTPEPGAAGLSFYGRPCRAPTLRSDDPAEPREDSVATAPNVTRAWALAPSGSRWTLRLAPDAPAGTPGVAWLVFRGPAVPPALDRLRGDEAVNVEPRIGARDPRAWRDAPDAVGGAGLLVVGGAPVTDWGPERTAETFRTDRHPRTAIGVDGDGRIWLVAVDGRNPNASVGMSLVELQRLCRALGLRDALNLDGGGSTTLVVNGRVVNQPSDVTGPRPVSDAIVVRLRREAS